MSSEGKQDRQLEIAHVLFIDIVGYSTLPINRQSELLQQLNQLVRATEQFRRAEAANKLVRLPTGDGMALVFFTSPDAPVKCAIEISKAVGQALPPAGGERQAGALALQLRMGINSGPVDAVADVNDRSNVAGAGINMAQRVMDCGDAGHILLSRRVADDLGQYENWQPYLHELGTVEVKHGIRVEVVNFYDEEVGNPHLPEKVKRAREEQSALDHRASRTASRKRSLIIGFLLLAAAVLIVGLAIVTYKTTRRSAATTTKTLPSLPEKSIAVLPFENMSADKDDAFFADGIQDDVLATLGKIKDLKVIGRASVMIYRGAAIAGKLREVGQALQVSHVLEGSVRRSASRVVVNVELIDTRNDKQVWSQRYDRTLTDTLSLQGELAVDIARELRATLTPQEKERVEARPTNNTAAYQAYLRGRAFGSGVTPDRPRAEGAVQSYQEAVKLDPDFAVAWAYLSCAQSSFYWSAFDPSPARLAAAKDALDHAVALAPNLPETHLALGYYRYYGKRDFTGALAEFQQAEQGLPNNVDIVYAIGLIQRRLGHWDEATAAMRRAVELDPRNIDACSTLAGNYMALRRFPDALAVSDHIHAIEPSNTQDIWLKAYCFWAMGNSEAVDQLFANPGTPLHLRGHLALNKHQYAGAPAMFSEALKEARGEEKNGILLDIGLAHQRAGNVAESKAAYQRSVQEFTKALNNLDKADTADRRVMAEQAPIEFAGAELHSLLGVAYAGLADATRAVSEGRKGMAMQPTSEDALDGPLREEQMARIYSLLGNADEAIPILKKWIQVPSLTSITPALLRLDPIWDPIRNDPRFQELVAEKKP
jgi:TolB-like protein/class 3 adenylate cyclase/Tfp pilus assembly protein PilF